MNKDEKQAEIELLSGNFKKAAIALCADYRGLTVGEVTTLRKELYKTGTRARVVKNTLARISAERTLKDGNEAELAKFLEIFDGPSFVAFSESDPVAPAKVITKFSKDTKEKLRIKGAWLDGEFVDAAGVETLSKMPGRQETLAKLLALIQAPATQLARLMQAPGTQLVRVLEAHRANLEKQG